MKQRMVNQIDQPMGTHASILIQVFLLFSVAIDPVPICTCPILKLHLFCTQVHCYIFDSRDLLTWAVHIEVHGYQPPFHDFVPFGTCGDAYDHELELHVCTGGQVCLWQLTLKLGAMWSSTGEVLMCSISGHRRCITLPLTHSWNKTSVTLFSEQLTTNASVATAMAVDMLPEFGINASSIRSVGFIICLE